MEYITQEEYRNQNPIDGLTLDELIEIKSLFDIGHPTRKKVNNAIAILKTNKKNYHDEWQHYKFEPMPTFAVNLQPTSHRNYSDYHIRS
jgi:hypothetical protein